MSLPDSAILNNLYVPGIAMPDGAFEKNYINCRTREKRMYTDEQVRQLPDCVVSDPHQQEWQMRKVSCKKMLAYLANKKKPLGILEIGCGNGWLSHQLATIPRSKVMGLDINFTELQQAARVFNHCEKIKFMYGDIRSGILADREFDIILFAASIQYFASLDGILACCLQHLKPGGEIHLTDTRFYLPKTVAAARERTDAYYSSIGCTSMAGYYFHHSLDTLAPFNHQVLYDPRSIRNRVLGSPLPFHWVLIKKDGCL